MPARKQPRRLARELALLSLSQLKGLSDSPEAIDLNALLLASVRTLTAEAHEALETASAELTRSSDRLLQSETRAPNLAGSKAMIKEAMELTQTAINRVGTAIELPEMVQLANQQEVREYALELIGTVHRRRAEIERVLEAGLVDWQLSRIPRIDRDILQMAVAEILFLEIPAKVAINEAVELGKQYSDDAGFRFINGVLRRVTDSLKGTVQISSQPTIQP
jgi:N utilization substance protein B